MGDKKRKSIYSTFKTPLEMAEMEVELGKDVVKAVNPDYKPLTMKQMYKLDQQKYGDNYAERRAVQRLEVRRKLEGKGAKFERGEEEE